MYIVDPAAVSLISGMIALGHRRVYRGWIGGGRGKRMNKRKKKKKMGRVVMDGGDGLLLLLSLLWERILLIFCLGQKGKEKKRETN